MIIYVKVCLLTDLLHDILCAIVDNMKCSGVLVDYLDCQVCHHPRSRDDIFLDISLTIKNIDNIEDGLKQFLEPELMNGNNQVMCNKCRKRQDFKKGLKFKKLPCILFIRLARFGFDWMENRRIKASNKVTFPKMLDMSTFVGDDCDQDKKDLQYELYGVMIHRGGAVGGHYYANIKSFEDDKWYGFNDSTVKSLNEEKEFDAAFGGGSRNETGYMLLYRQKNLNLPDNYGYVPKYLINMIEKEDE